MIAEIQDNIKTGDSMKAQIVLSHLGRVDKQTQNRLIYELSRGDASFSTPLLLYLLNEHQEVTDELPIVRETMLSNLMAYPELLVTFLKEPKIRDKTHLISVVGELHFDEAVPALLEILAATDDEALIMLIVKTLGQVADPLATNALTDYLYSANRELIFAAVQSLGQVGTPTAMHRLAERMGTDNEIDFMILSIFAEVQDQVSLSKLNDTLRSHYAHMRTYAKKELAAIGPKAVPFLIDNLKNDDPDFLIHTLNVLGDIGDESAVKPIRKLLGNEPKNANVRFA
ncbi:MAG: response regulator, partial [Deltaproteobacteria bacterium]